MTDSVPQRRYNKAEYEIKAAGNPVNLLDSVEMLSGLTRGELAARRDLTLLLKFRMTSIEPITAVDLVNIVKAEMPCDSNAYYWDDENNIIEFYKK